MALTWPYADPHFAAYMFAAAAAAAYGGHQPGGAYWGARATPYPNPYMMTLPPARSTSPPFLGGTSLSPTGSVGARSELPEPPIGCDSPVCRGYPTTTSTGGVLPLSLTPPATTEGATMSSNSKPLFQPYKIDSVDNKPTRASQIMV